MENVRIYRLTPETGYRLEDLERLSRLLGGDRWPVTDRTVRDILANPLAYLFVAEIEGGGHYVGFRLITIFPSIGGLNCWSGPYAVDEAYRNAGLGEQLVRVGREAVQTLANERGERVVMNATIKPRRKESLAVAGKLGDLELVAQATGPNGTNLFRLIFDPKS